MKHFLTLLFALQTVVSFSQMTKKNTPPLYYHPFYNDIQMITVDKITPWRLTINSLYFEMPARNTPWEFEYPKPMNGYIFRKKNGKIIQTYNLTKAEIKDLAIKSVKKVTESLIYHNQVFQNFERPYENPHITSRYEYYIIVEGKTGLIDSIGNVVLEPKYQRIQPIREVFFLFLENNLIQPVDTLFRPLTTKPFSELTPYDNNWYTFEEEGKFGLLDKDFKVLIPAKYTLKPQNFQRGYAKVFIKKNNERFCGLINEKGKEICGLKYKDIGVFNEGYVNVKKGEKWGYLDQKGREVIPCKFDQANIFINGIAQVRKGKRFEEHKYGFINKKGNFVIPIKYNHLSYPEEGLCLACVGRKCGYINLNGEEVIPLIYDNVTYFRNGKAKVSQNGQSFYIDKKGNKVNEN